MNRLKIVEKGWAGFTGVFGYVNFVNGISPHGMTAVEQDAITGLIKMVEIDDNGVEIGIASIAERLIQTSADRAPVKAELNRQTEAERLAEERENLIRASKPPVDRFYTGAELEALIKEKGLKGLRDAAAPWGLKGRSIPQLLDALVEAQQNYYRIRDRKLAKLNEPKPAEPEKLVDLSVLFGSSTLAATYEINGRTYSLGDIVRAAFEKSGASIPGWNGLKEEARDIFLNKELDHLATLPPDAEPDADAEPEFDLNDPQAPPAEV